MINARVETVATSKFFRSIWKSGRCIVPADGWYEWLKSTGDRDYKQPYYIKRADNQPLYFAGVGQFSNPGAEPEKGDAFVIITGESDRQAYRPTQPQTTGVADPCSAAVAGFKHQRGQCLSAAVSRA